MTGREQLVDAYLRLHPESAARLLESMPVEQANAVLSAVDVATAAPVVSHMLATQAARCMEQQSPEDSALLLEKLGSQESVAVLRHLADRDPRARAGLPRSRVADGVQAAALLPDEHGGRVGGAARADAARRLQRRRGARPRRAQRSGGAGAGSTCSTARDGCAAPCAASALLQVTHRKGLAAILEPADALWARDLLATAQEHSMWERHTEAPVVNRDEEFIGVISYADLRKAYRQLTRVANGRNDREIAEVTELIAIGAGSVWKSLGDLMRTDGRG